MVGLDARRAGPAARRRGPRGGPARTWSSCTCTRGYEYDELPSPEQVDAVARLTRSPDVDLVLGEHAHTVQPITRVNGKWVVYGMGNLVAQQEVTRPETYRGILVRFTFVERPDGAFAVRRAAYVPVGWNKASAGLPDPGPPPRRAR